MVKAKVTSGKTILPASPTCPAGQFLRTMAPGVSAAFQFFTRVPGDLPNIEYVVVVYRGEGFTAS